MRLTPAEVVNALKRSVQQMADNEAGPGLSFPLQLNLTVWM
jgi:hypothetical protein